MLAYSYTPAFRRFLALEKRLAANENIRQEYLQFMQEYEKLGHMEVISRAVNGPQFFLPHHAVHRPESTTTKTRVVFDGSCRGTNNVSINEALVAGPTIQPVLYSTVINFRKPRFVVTADVEKMFRQIWVHSDDCRFQQILWRYNPVEPIQVYQLKTVTYGLTSSPFHATRVLSQLALEDGERYPLAVPVIRQGTYVDDVLTGHDDLKTLQQTCEQLIGLLANAKFVLRKWATNDSTVLIKVPTDLWDASNQLEIDRTASIKTLGLLWLPKSDGFMFKIPTLHSQCVITKGVVVSEMSRLFDPIGLLGPVVINAKIPKKNCGKHCFCDASTKGYGCCIYIVFPNEAGELQSHLLTSKSRVASLRGHSVPRLKLSAARLGSQLVDKLKRTTQFTESATMWTDSTIVLHWIKSKSSKWKVFVSNRVAEIQRLTKGLEWKHVPTNLNPADRISRGTLASHIVKDDLWWHGPNFLRSTIDNWPDQPMSLPENLQAYEEAQCVVSLHMSDSPDDFNVITPGHFLIGESLVSISEPDLSHINPGHLDRLQHMKKSLQDLWARWSQDYVSQLHQRSKWKSPQPDLQPGQLVLLKENSPPLQWPLGRIIETIPRRDGHIRVVVVKTTTGKYKRAITEVAALPTSPDEV
ncbi:uncharacterized protein LOC129726607 [Wyeomyia smithii]|uniref:uncharacterized protein LOC129726607 n=1 Tax=Wyeomyia smithii TaxID=174621 RepID=UPI002467CDCB|nr:uncharacterized protein LOC129726607 [Wyeomyia smithii]